MNMVTVTIFIITTIITANELNGCLEIAPGTWGPFGNTKYLNTAKLTETGIVDPDFEKALFFEPVPCKPGDILLFHGFGKKIKKYENFNIWTSWIW